MEQDELLERFEKEFGALKQELKFRSTLDDIDKICYIRDVILSMGYVPKYLSRLVCRNITDTFKAWGNYFHGVVIPNPHSLLSVNESRMFSDEEKNQFKDLMSQIMVLSSRHALNGITNDKIADGKFIDDAMKFWNKTLNPKIIEVLKKVHREWGKKPEVKKQE